MELGATAEVTWSVDESDTAIAQQSGNVPVLATPRLVAICEAAAVAAIASELVEGETTVGSHIAIDHLAPSPVGAEITARAELIEIKGRKLVFEVTATEGEKIIGQGIHHRARVDKSRFLASLTE